MKTIGVILIVWSGYSILMGSSLWLWAVLAFAIGMVMDDIGEHLKARVDYYNSGK